MSDDFYSKLSKEQMIFRVKVLSRMLLIVALVNTVGLMLGELPIIAFGNVFSAVLLVFSMHFEPEPESASLTPEIQPKEKVDDSTNGHPCYCTSSDCTAPKCVRYDGL